MDADLATDAIYDPHAASVPYAEERALFTAILREAFNDLASPRGSIRAGAFRWFTSDARDYASAFVLVCEAIDVDPGVIRAKALERWQRGAGRLDERRVVRPGGLMGEPATKTFTCERCAASFTHTYPLGYGKPCRFCPACKASPAKSKPAPSTALVPAKPATALPAVRPARNGGGAASGTQGREARDGDHAARTDRARHPGARRRADGGARRARRDDSLPHAALRRRRGGVAA